MQAVSLKLKKLLDTAIREYNKYRSPESIATLVRINGNTVIVKFDGSFCRTCGINDWVEDFKYVLEDLGAEADLVEVIEPDPLLPEEDWRIGVFHIKKLPSSSNQTSRQE